MKAYKFLQNTEHAWHHAVGNHLERKLDRHLMKSALTSQSYKEQVFHQGFFFKYRLHEKSVL